MNAFQTLGTSRISAAAVSGGQRQGASLSRFLQQRADSLLGRKQSNPQSPVTEIQIQQTEAPQTQTPESKTETQTQAPIPAYSFQMQQLQRLHQAVAPQNLHLSTINTVV